VKKNIFKNKNIIISALALFTTLSIIVNLFIGLHHISIWDILLGNSAVKHSVFWQIRLPRIIFAFLAGASFALSGLIFQTLLRNDLATPYTLGVASGGSFGAVVAIKSGIIFHIIGISSVSLFSVIVSVLTILVVYYLANRIALFNSYSLVLIGVTIGMFFSALTLFFHYLADFTETYKMIRWTMGSLDITNWYKILLTFVVFITALSFFYKHNSALNIYLTGNDLALSRGVNVEQLKKHSFVIASVLVGIVVSFSGPIGFIGLITPHLVRVVVGPSHRWLIPLTVLAGGAGLMWCDTISRVIIAPAEIPVGVVTSLLGGPFFIYILLRKKTP
jgi:iron complex transport system permease protein